MDRNIEILLEMIADNYEVLKEYGNIDLGHFEYICSELNWNVKEYLEDNRNRQGYLR